MFSKTPRGGGGGEVAMHVVYLITRGDAVGGATIHVRDLAREWIRRGNRATILTGGAGEAYQEFRRYGIPCEVVPALRRSIHPLRDAAAVVRIAAALRRLEPDLVSAHTAKAGLLGRVAAKMAGVPCVFTAHGWSIADRVSRAGGLIFTLAERLAAPLAARIVNVCQAEQDLALRRGIAGPDRFELIHNGVHDVPPALCARPETEPPHLITVARFEPPKDPLLQLEALSRLGGVAEAVTPETGLLVPRGDAGALAAALRRLIADPGLRVQMGRAARARYQRHFTFSMTCAKTFDLYQRVLGAAIARQIPAEERV